MQIVPSRCYSVEIYTIQVHENDSHKRTTSTTGPVATGIALEILKNKPRNSTVDIIHIYSDSTGSFVYQQLSNADAIDLILDVKKNWK